jgi:plasmid replication initiation protein
MDDPQKVIRDVKKPIEAIQCANTFSLIQRKMYNVLLANAAGSLLNNVTHRISMGMLCNLMGYGSRDYNSIKNQFRELRRMDIEWDIINEEGHKVWTNTSPLSLARIIEGKGICEYEFTPSLLPYLDRPAQYAKFSLKVQSKFKSSYGLALYENCERYRKLGKTKSFEIPMFRKLMGVQESQYQDFFALKRRVILIAIKEVNKHAEFDIFPEFEKCGRQIVKIRFIIISKKIDASTLTTAVSTDDEVSPILRNVFLLNEKEIKKIIKTYDIPYIKEKIDYVINSEKFKKGGIRNIISYLKSALNEDYKPSLSSKVVIEKINREKEFEEAQLKALKELISTAHRAYQSMVSSQIIEVSSKMDDLNKITEDFSKFLEDRDKFAFGYFNRKGVNHPAVMYFYKQFIRDQYPRTLDSVLTPKQFLNDEYPQLLIHLSEEELHGWS